ncbi:MAG: DUF1761 domain-containing protein [Chitinophagaceae bacterium]|nr:DUF1761 domain-containing protein [Chitinophagaceae bacterium]
MGNLFDYINWIAVLVAALAYFALGALWYSKILFAPKWIAYLKIDVNDPEAKKGMGMMFGGSFLMMFIISLAIAILAGRLDLSGWMSGLKLGAFIAVCFCITSTAINYLYEKKPLGLLLINGGYQLVGSIIAGIIICSWQ